MGAYDIRFLFQAEDGIRDYDVTGVQTCALPISDSETPAIAAEEAKTAAADKAISFFMLFSFQE